MRAGTGLSARARAPAAVGVVLAAAAIAVLALVGRDPPRPQPAAARSGTAGRVTHPVVPVSPGVTILDAGSGGVRAVVPPLVVRRPLQARYQAGRFWVFNADTTALVRVDPGSGDVLGSIALPFSAVGSYLVDRGGLWVSNQRSGVVARVDLRGRVVRSFGRLPGSGGSVGLALAGGLLWVARPLARHGTGVLVAVDPSTGQVRRRIGGLLGTYQLTSAPDGSFWTAGTFGSVNHIDPSGGGRTHGETGGRNYAIATDGRHAWTADTVSGAVSELDARGRVVQRVRTLPGARSVSYADGAVWIGNAREGTVTRIAAGGQITSWRFDHRVVALAAGGGAVLVAFGEAVAG